MDFLVTLQYQQKKQADIWKFLLQPLRLELLRCVETFAYAYTNTIPVARLRTGVQTVGRLTRDATTA